MRAAHRLCDFRARCVRARSHERVYVVEQNRDAQLLSLMKMEFEPAEIAKLKSVRYYGGLPIDARTVTDNVLSQEKTRKEGK
jgi:hypothetical protein